MTLTFQNVTKRFAEKTVFADFSHTFCLEGITALMGDSGCGKTTLLRLMCGLEKPNTGEIRGIPTRFTFLFQEDRLLPWSDALENVSLVSDKETAERMLCAVGLQNELHAMPAALSGGMQRRVALARALAHPSELLLLDEPLKGLDADLRAQMVELFKAESANRPILFVTHTQEEAELADAQVLHLHGSPARL